MRQAVTAPERGWEWRARGGRRWGEGGGVCQPADRSGQEEPNTHIPPPHPFPHSFHPSLASLHRKSIFGCPQIDFLISTNRFLISTNRFFDFHKSIFGCPQIDFWVSTTGFF